MSNVIHQVFNESWLYYNAKVGERACVQVGVNFWFPDDSLSLLGPIDTKLGMWVADIQRQLRIATNVSMIKVKTTVAKSI